MSKITDLLKKLRAECDDERDMFSGTKERQFFVEMLGVSDVSGLLDMYDPKTHNVDWVTEYQKRYPDIDKLMKSGRSVDFMSAGKLGCIRHYVDNELRAHVVGTGRMNWNHNVLNQTEDFVTMDYAKTT